MNSFLLSFWLAAAPDPRRNLCFWVDYVEDPSVVQIALEKATQIFRAAHPEFGGLVIDGELHFGWATEG